MGATGDQRRGAGWGEQKGGEHQIVTVVTETSSPNLHLYGA